MVTATITSKGQVTIPKSVRDSLHLHTGDKVAFVVNADSEATMMAVTRSVEQVFGRLHVPGQKARSVDDMNEAIKKRLRGSPS